MLDDDERRAITFVILFDPRNEPAIIKRSRCDDEAITPKIITFTELPGLELDAGAISNDCNRP